MYVLFYSVWSQVRLEPPTPSLQRGYALDRDCYGTRNRVLQGLLALY